MPVPVRLFALWVATAMVTLGCAGTFRSPARGGPAWLELSSEHFVLESDLSVETATRALESFETFRAALEQIAFRSKSQPKGRTRITLFAREEEYREIAAPGTGGHFLRVGSPIELEPRIVFSHGGNPLFVQSLQHELVHRYIAFHFPSAPIWLNEGLAEFYSTLEAHDGNATFGSPSLAGILPIVARGKIVINGKRIRLSRYLPTVERLAAMDAREFYGYDKPAGSAAFVGTRIAHYGIAWALTYVLMLDDPKRHERFLAYLNLLKSGSLSPHDAWQKSFRAEEPELERAVRSVIAGAGLFKAKTAFDPPPLSNIRVRRMSAAEVHRLWAQIRLPIDAAARARAREDIDRALELAPWDPKARVLLAAWYAQGKDVSKAEAILIEAAKRTPSAAEPLYALVGFYMSREEAKPTAAQRFEPIAPWVERLERVATQSAHWNAIAWYWALREQPARGIEPARRAVEEDSSCGACYDTLALLLYQQGAVFDATQAQRIALNLLDTPDHRVKERLALFEERLGELKQEVRSSARPLQTALPGVVTLDASCDQPAALATPRPTYPAAALRNDVQGTVVVQFIVREDGSVTDAVALDGPALLAEAAVAAIKAWRFSPARCGGQAVATLRTVRLPFRIRD